MDGNVPDDLIEIHDPEIDPAQIVEQIRERIRMRRHELGYEDMVFPTFGATAYPGEPEDIPYDRDLYYHLRLANEIYTQAETEAVLVPSLATGVPLLGRLWRLVRREAHNLVLFYVNRAVAHQTDVNRHLVSALNQLAVMSQDQQRILLSLRSEIEALRSSTAKQA